MARMMRDTVADMLEMLRRRSEGVDSSVIRRLEGELQQAEARVANLEAASGVGGTFQTGVSNVPVDTPPDTGDRPLPV